jgi:hypothetical protein
VDVEHRAARRRPPHRTEQRPDLDHQSGLFPHLTAYRVGVRLAGLNPAAGDRPPAAARFGRPADQQQPAAGVVDDGTDAPDEGPDSRIHVNRP